MFMKAICIYGDWVKHNIKSLYIQKNTTQNKFNYQEQIHRFFTCDHL